MNIFFIIVIILLVFLIIVFIKKSKSKECSTQEIESSYSNESIQILVKNFAKNDFTKNDSLKDFKNKLGIKSTYKKELKSIIESTLHRIDVHYKFSINSNKPYSDLTTFKLAANEVIDYCIKNDIDINSAIILTLLTITNESIKEKLDEEFDDTKYLESFYELLPGFIKRYNKKLNS